VLKDHVNGYDRFDQKVSVKPENGVRQKGVLLHPPEGQTQKSQDKEKGREGGWRMEERSGEREIMVDVEPGRMRIDEEAEIEDEDPALG
jgi:hypothetical protein